MTSVAPSADVRSLSHPGTAAAAPSSTGNLPISSGHSVIKPPVYGPRDVMLEQQAQFAKEFIIYSRKLALLSLSAGVTFNVVPMSSCMTFEAQAHHSRFDMDNRAAEAVPERDWEQLFERSLQHPARSKSVVIARVKQLSMDNTLLRVDDRMSAWQGAYLKVLMKEGAEDMDHFHPKPVIQALLSGIKPSGVKALVKEACDFDDAAIKHNIELFWALVRTTLERALPVLEAEANAARVKAILGKKCGDAALAPVALRPRPRSSGSRRSRRPRSRRSKSSRRRLRVSALPAGVGVGPKPLQSARAALASITSATSPVRPTRPRKRSSRPSARSSARRSSRSSHRSRTSRCGHPSRLRGRFQA